MVEFYSVAGRERGPDAHKTTGRTPEQTPGPKPRTQGQRRAAAKRRADHVDSATAFLEAFAIYGSIRRTCQELGCSASTHYKRLAESEEYAAAFAQAEEEAIQHLEDVARRRADQGVPRMKFHQGKPCRVRDSRGRMVDYVEYEYSDQLLMFLLRAHRPAKYRERYDPNQTGSDEYVKVIVPPEMENRG